MWTLRFNQYNAENLHGPYPASASLRAAVKRKKIHVGAPAATARAAWCFPTSELAPWMFLDAVPVSWTLLDAASLPLPHRRCHLPNLLPPLRRRRPPRRLCILHQHRMHPLHAHYHVRLFGEFLFKSAQISFKFLVDTSPNFPKFV